MHFYAEAALGMPADDAMANAYAAAQRALAIDPALPETHVLLALIASTHHFDWETAAREFHSALAREPVSPWALDMYGAFYLLQVGRVDEAGKAIRRALEEDPLNLVYRVHWSAFLLSADRVDEAVAELQAVLQFDSDFMLGHAWLQAALALKGSWRDVLTHAQRLYASAALSQWAGGLAGALVRTGDRAGAEALLTRLESGVDPGSLMGLTMFHMMAGDTERALEFVSQALERGERFGMLPSLLRLFCSASPRWSAIAKILGLPTRD